MIGDAHKFLLAPGGADVETDEPTPSFRSDADEDITEGPGPMIVGNLVSTQLWYDFKAITLRRILPSHRVQAGPLEELTSEYGNPNTVAVPLF